MLISLLLGCDADADSDDWTVEATSVWSIDDGPTGRWIAVGSTADGYGVASHVCPDEIWWYERYDLAGTTLEFARDGQFYLAPVSQIAAVLSAPCEILDCDTLEAALLKHDDIPSAVCEVENAGCLCRYMRDEQPLAGEWVWNESARTISLTIENADHPGTVVLGFDVGQNSDATVTMSRGETMLIRIDLDRLAK